MLLPVIRLQMIASLKCQYAELLAEIGFIQADLTARKMGRLAPRTGDGVLVATGEMVNHTGREGNNKSDRHGIREQHFFFRKLEEVKRHYKENRAVFFSNVVKRRGAWNCKE